MPQASSWPYCNITTDLQRAFKDIENFFQPDTLTSFSLTSGQTNTYEKYNTGTVGIVFEDGVALTEKTSIATVEGTASTFWYDSTNDILYVHTSGSDNPSGYTITGAVDSWSDLKTTMRNDAMEIVESMLDAEYPRPLPFSATSYNSAKYDSDIRRATALITCSLIVKYRDPDNPMGDMLEKMVMDEDEDKGILWQYKHDLRKFSFETTKDEFRGNMEVITHDTTSTGRIYIAGNPTAILREKYRIKFTTGGVPETAKFQFSDDGGLNYDTSDSHNTYSNWFHLVYDLWIRCEGTFVANDEWEITIADSLQEVKSSISSIDIKTSGY